MRYPGNEWNTSPIRIQPGKRRILENNAFYGDLRFDWDPFSVEPQRELRRTDAHSGLRFDCSSLHRLFCCQRQVLASDWQYIVRQIAGNIIRWDSPGSRTIHEKLTMEGPDKVNVALGKNVTQSSTNGSLRAEKAVDGDDTECAETNTESQPWWKVDLAGFYRVSRVSILSRYVYSVRSGVRAVGVTTPPSLADEDVVNLVPVPGSYIRGHPYVRLVGGSAAHEGRVEVFHDGAWGTICDYGWDIRNANVVCRQLGYSGADEAKDGAFFGQGTEQIWLDDVNCIGIEARLSQCRHGGWGVHYCGHHEDAGVICIPGITLTVRVGVNEDVNQNDQCGQTFSLTHGQTREVECNSPMLGRYVSIQNMAESNSLSLCEVEVYFSDICCNPTIRLLNGHITATDGYCSGNKIQFSCHPGYELVGWSGATCQEDGRWDREIPTCQRATTRHRQTICQRPINEGDHDSRCQVDPRARPGQRRTCCDNTTRIKNGQIRVDDDYCYGDIQFSCDTGYELVGSPFAFCQDKNWDRVIPTCQRICCDNTTDIMNGRVNATDGYCSGNDIQFSCNPGYELVGRSEATCQEDGNWNRDIPTCQLPTEESRTSTEAIIGGTSAGIAALLIVAAVVFTRKPFRCYPTSKLARALLASPRRRLAEMVPLVPARPQFPKLETDPSRVTLGEKIGSGAFGIVYRATLTRNDRTEDVVVKTLKENASEEDKLGFLEEIRAVVDLGVHKNLLGLLGCCTVVRDHLYLITEFMPYGDLKSFLRKCREEATSDEPGDDIYTFEVMQMYQVARQIARGMDHIARSRYVHGDLAARNVLVGKRLHVKISDFGLAEDIYSRGYRRQDRLQRVPWKWMAPERLEDGKAYTSQSDVWSFGIVLYEICTLGGDPYPGVSVSELKDRLQAGFRMDQPEDCPRAMYDLMQQCWRWQPIQRPLFSQLYLTLDKHLAFYGPEAKGTSAHTTLQGKAEGGRLRGRPRRTWTSDLKEWTGHPLSHLTSIAENRSGWMSLVDSLVAPTAVQTAMGPMR
ncbi:Leucine-rich repeat-containing protein 15 [Branchiostoma belcheri]|nr:Leucine-rich repeat-containing protein 15 [Branchiostoma belcheri]